MNKGLRILLLGVLLALSSGCAVVNAGLDAGGRMVGGLGASLSETDNSLLQAGGQVYTTIGVGLQRAAARDQEKKKPE